MVGGSCSACTRRTRRIDSSSAAAHQRRQAFESVGDGGGGNPQVLGRDPVQPERDLAQRGRAARADLVQQRLDHMDGLVHSDLGTG